MKLSSILIEKVEEEGFKGEHNEFSFGYIAFKMSTEQPIQDV